MNSQQETTATEKYFEQRVVTSGDTITVNITYVHLNKKSDTLHIGVQYDTEEIELQTNITDGNANTLLKFLEWMCVTETGEINHTQHINDQIEIKYNNNEDSFTHIQTEHSFTPKQTNNKTQTTDGPEIETKLKNTIIDLAYETGDIPHNKNAGLQCRVIDVTDPEGDELTITASPHANIRLQWEITLPHVTEITDTALETFIENQGGGNPKYIESGNIVILHEDDVTETLDVVAYDTTGTWALIPPNIHESWDENKTTAQNTTTSTISKNNTQNTTNSTSTSSSNSSSSSSTTSSLPSISISTSASPRKKKQRREKARKVILNAVALTFVSGVGPMLFESLLPPIASQTSIIPVVNTVTGLSGVFGAFMMVYGGLLLAASH